MARQQQRMIAQINGTQGGVVPLIRRPLAIPAPFASEGSARTKGDEDGCKQS
ncbi:MAG: hypothetical protein OZSIB_2680 [Candidatus Ozemobacter sibiricus]|jgi:hypothetical protein|uniref:Uncharacterized protein n=1 Tax=Candidatus Ozemobacter sibiricus TaxID=2268124 RepID=A0A367ZTW4_9BACT|nr:MAG: hypothetical protein OZSIB_2680 [Candidatus Ozemobacter sibiricus]